MTMMIDQSPVNPALPANPTVSDAIAWAQSQLPDGKIITKIELDGQYLEGPALNLARPTLLGDRALAFSTSDRKELSLSMLGRIYALIEWLSPQHKQVAGLLEKGESAPAFDQLARIFATWQQIQSAFGGLAKLNGIVLSDLQVGELSGETVLNEFCAHLAEMQGALQNRDLVMLADILQYEMDGAVANWTSLLESTLAIIEPSAAAAA